MIDLNNLENLFFIERLNISQINTNLNLYEEIIIHFLCQINDFYDKIITNLKDEKQIISHKTPTRKNYKNILNDLFYEFLSGKNTRYLRKKYKIEDKKIRILLIDYFGNNYDDIIKIHKHNNKQFNRQITTKLKIDIVKYYNLTNSISETANNFNLKNRYVAKVLRDFKKLVIKKQIIKNPICYCNFCGEGLYKKNKFCSISCYKKHNAKNRFIKEQEQNNFIYKSVPNDVIQYTFKKTKDIYLVYKITNILNGKVYFGKTTNSLQTRFDGHLKSVKNNSNSHIHNAIRKYGPGNFIMQEVKYFYNEFKSLQYERKMIKKYDTMVNGYNSTDGGEGFGGHKFSIESKIKMSESKKNIYDGEKNPNAKLTWEKVKEIRELAKENTAADISKKYNISYATVRSIIRGSTWK